MITYEWPIEDIIVAHPGLYLEHCAVMAAAVMRKISRSPCAFIVECVDFTPAELEGESRFLMQVAWNHQTDIQAERVLRTEQPKPIVERGAVAVAALAFAHLVPGGRLRVTEEGDRADYWLPIAACVRDKWDRAATRSAPPLSRKSHSAAGQSARLEWIRICVLLQLGPPADSVVLPRAGG